MGKVAAITGQFVYVDANVFIYAVEDLVATGAFVRDLFARCERGEIHAVTSELTLAEVLVKPIRDGNTRGRRSYDAMLMSGAALTVAPVQRSILVAAAEIRARSSLKLPDAVHAATCSQMSCATFITNDQAFSKLPELNVALISELIVRP